eukprot:8009961-Lingulodinium_polyedra.AAC.1
MELAGRSGSAPRQSGQPPLQSLLTLPTRCFRSALRSCLPQRSLLSRRSSGLGSPLMCHASGAAMI